MNQQNHNIIKKIYRISESKIAMTDVISTRRRVSFEIVRPK